MVRAAGILLFARSTGRCLLLQRPDGRWEAPGGRLEPGETPLEAALEELQEETGFRGSLILDGGRQTSDNYVLFVGEVAREFRPRLSHEHVDYLWVEPGSPPEPLRKGLRGVL